jgi:hypothetical protein
LKNNIFLHSKRKQELAIYWEAVDKAIFANRTISRYSRFCKILCFSVSAVLLFYYRCLSVALYGLCKAVISQFFYVVHHTIKQPLDIDLYLSPLVKFVQPFVHPNVGK